MLSELNQQQRIAVVDSFKQDTLVLAGAGSGKTRVLTSRIQYIVEKYNMAPNRIMAITFTNKAANELITRIRKINEDADQMWVGTYHSICLKLLRMFGDEIGIDNFTILDPDDAKKAAKEVLCEMGAITDNVTLKYFMSKMSNLKNNLITPKAYRERRTGEYNPNYDSINRANDYEFIEFYSIFQRRNLERQTFDFDDLIFYTILLIRSSEKVKEFIKNTFKFVHAKFVGVYHSNVVNYYSLNCWDILKPLLLQHNQ